MSGEEVLMQACAQWHNESLDQTLSRARFNVDSAGFGRREGPCSGRVSLVGR